MNALPSVNTMLEKKYKRGKIFFIPPKERLKHAVNRLFKERGYIPS